MNIWKKIRNHPFLSIATLGVLSYSLMHDEKEQEKHNHHFVDAIVFILSFFFLGVILFHIFAFSTMEGYRRGRFIVQEPVQEQEILHGAAPEDNVSFEIPEGVPTYLPEDIENVETVEVSGGTN